MGAIRAKDEERDQRGDCRPEPCPAILMTPARLVHAERCQERRQEVRDAPLFVEVWPEVSRVIEGAAFLAAHNASFERSVLRAGCPDAARLARAMPFLCTVRLAREVWSLHRARLPDVCGLLGIALDHHDALSDAEACARIVLAAGHELSADEVRRRAARGE